MLNIFLHGTSGYQVAGGGTGYQHQQPDKQKLCRYSPAAGLEGQAADNKAQTDIICFGQCMQPGIYVWKAYQPHGAGEKKRQPQEDEYGAAMV